MVAMAALAYPIATTISHKPQNPPRNPTIQSSIPVPPSPSKLTKRKNYLRRKILKTLPKPYPIPLSPPISEEPIEPNVETPSKPISEEQSSSLVVESETLYDANESISGQLQVVPTQESSSNWFTGGMIVRIVASLVGLFVLQTMVAVWVLGKGGSDEKDRDLGIAGSGRDRKIRLGVRNGEVGLDGNWVLKNVDELEMEGKIAEIRKMAREAREVEKKSLKSGEADGDDAGEEKDEEDEDEDDVKTDIPRIRSGIMKEVDGRLTKLRKNSPPPLLNVNLLNKGGDIGKEGKSEDVGGKEEVDMLMFEMKHKFRSHLTIPEDKPKGFQSVEGGDGVREKPRNVDDEQLIQMNGNAGDNGASSSKDNQKIYGLGSSLPERSNIDSQKDEKKPGSQRSGPLEPPKKGFGSSSATKASRKTFQSNSATKKLNKRINGGDKPERGVVQDSSHENRMDDGPNLKDSSAIAFQDSQRKMNVQDASKTHVMSRGKALSNSNELGSKLSLSRDNDNWWYTLPYVLVILMQTGPDSEGKQGFYTIRIPSNAKNQSYTSYIVSFEDLGDARNFSYLLESAFEELPDATIDIVPLSAKELKEVMESLNKRVIVVKKGELQLYAGQPLTEVESALRSLVE